MSVIKMRVVKFDKELTMQILQQVRTRTVYTPDSGFHVGIGYPALYPTAVYLQETGVFEGDAPKTVSIRFSSNVERDTYAARMTDAVRSWAAQVGGGTTPTAATPDNFIIEA